MKLYQNEISSATSRVRIALALKGLTAEALPVSILGEDAESRQAGYRSVNPQGLVPALLTDSGVLLTQSLAIVEYLDEIKPEPPLLPDTAEGRAQARSIALAIAAEIHALLPPRIGLHLGKVFQADADAITAWRGRRGNGRSRDDDRRPQAGSLRRWGSAWYCRDLPLPAGDQRPAPRLRSRPLAWYRGDRRQTGGDIGFPGECAGAETMIQSMKNRPQVTAADSLLVF